MSYPNKERSRSNVHLPSGPELKIHLENPEVIKALLNVFSKELTNMVGHQLLHQVKRSPSPSRRFDKQTSHSRRRSRSRDRHCSRSSSSEKRSKSYKKARAYSRSRSRSPQSRSYKSSHQKLRKMDSKNRDYSSKVSRSRSNSSSRSRDRERTKMRKKRKSRSPSSSERYNRYKDSPEREKRNKLRHQDYKTKKEQNRDHKMSSPKKKDRSRSRTRSRSLKRKRKRKNNRHDRNRSRSLSKDKRHSQKTSRSSSIERTGNKSESRNFAKQATYQKYEYTSKVIITKNMDSDKRACDRYEQTSTTENSNHLIQSISLAEQTNVQKDVQTVKETLPDVDIEQSQKKIIPNGLQPTFESQPSQVKSPIPKRSSQLEQKATLKKSGGYNKKETQTTINKGNKRDLQWNFDGKPEIKTYKKDLDRPKFVYSSRLSKNKDANTAFNMDNWMFAHNSNVFPELDDGSMKSKSTLQNSLADLLTFSDATPLNKLLASHKSSFVYSSLISQGRDSQREDTKSLLEKTIKEVAMDLDINLLNIPSELKGAVSKTLLLANSKGEFVDQPPVQEEDTTQSTTFTADLMKVQAKVVLSQVAESRVPRHENDKYIQEQNHVNKVIDLPVNESLESKMNLEYTENFLRQLEKESLVKRHSNVQEGSASPEEEQMSLNSPISSEEEVMDIIDNHSSPEQESSLPHSPIDNKFEIQETQFMNSEELAMVRDSNNNNEDMRSNLNLEELVDHNGNENELSINNNYIKKNNLEGFIKYVMTGGDINKLREKLKTANTPKQ